MLQPLNREYHSKRQDRKHARPEPEIARPHLRVVQDLENELEDHRRRNGYNYRLPFIHQQPILIPFPPFSLISLLTLEMGREGEAEEGDIHVYTKNTNPSQPPPSFSFALTTTPQQPRTK